jgi:hypothetical protein
MERLQKPPLSQLSKLNQRTTASPTLITLPSKKRRRRHLVLVFLSPASPTKAASRTRNGQMLRQLLRKKRKTSLLDLAERPSASVSVSKSKFLRSTSASLRLLREVVEDAVDLVAVAAVEMALPEADEAISNAVMDKDEVTVVDAPEATSRAPHVLVQAVQLKVAHLSTPMIQVLSRAWDHRISKQKSPDGLHVTTDCLRNVFTGERSSKKLSAWVRMILGWWIL